jgi:hypothetical protein
MYRMTQKNTLEMVKNGFLDVSEIRTSSVGGS